MNDFLEILISSRLTKTDIELAAFILKEYKNDEAFEINAYMKTKLSTMSGRSVESYNNSTRALIKFGIIYEVANRVYKIKFAPTLNLITLKADPDFIANWRKEVEIASQLPLKPLEKLNNW